MEQLVEELEEKIVKRIKEARDKDEEVIKVVEEMKKAEVKILRDKEWQIEKRLVLKKGICLKATILYTCALTSSSRSFHHFLGL